MRTAKRTPLIHAGRAFVLALAAGLVLVGCMEWSRRNQERDRMGFRRLSPPQAKSQPRAC